MSAKVFIDTNVFLYSLSDNPEEKLKAERARQILLNENWGWSVQVAGGFLTSRFHRSVSFDSHVRWQQNT